MKRLLILALAFALCAQASIARNLGLGVVAGYTAGYPDNGGKPASGYHFGATLKCPLAVGFAIQPSLLYQVKGMTSVESKFSQGNLELPVSIQWGPDLFLLRPYLEAVPFVGCNLWNRCTVPVGGKTAVEGANAFEYGLGLGGGLEVWKFQLSARYCWNFNPVFKTETGDKLGTVMVSLAFLF